MSARPWSSENCRTATPLPRARVRRKSDSVWIAWSYNIHEFGSWGAATISLRDAHVAEDFVHNFLDARSPGILGQVFEKRPGGVAALEELVALRVNDVNEVLELASRA